MVLGTTRCIASMTMKISSRPDEMPAAVRRSCVNCETSSPMPPKTPQIRERLRPNAIEAPNPISPFTASPLA